jgi:hypothetical protein
MVPVTGFGTCLTQAFMEKGADFERFLDCRALYPDTEFVFVTCWCMS